MTMETRTPGQRGRRENHVLRSWNKNGRYRPKVVGKVDSNAERGLPGHSDGNQLRITRYLNGACDTEQGRAPTGLESCTQEAVKNGETKQGQWEDGKEQERCVEEVDLRNQLTTGTASSIVTTPLWRNLQVK